MKMNRMSKYAAAAGICAALLTGCGMAPTSAPDGSVGFPARDSAWLKEGTFVNVENLRQIGPGLDKNQVYALIGEPHFSEGIIGVHVWNYVFNFRTGPGASDVVTCQYQIQYDKHYRVKSTYWKEPACKALVDGPKPAPAVQAPPGDDVKQFTLDYQLLFPFDKSALRDLLPAGRAELDRIAATLEQQYQHIRSVRVTGYTDRLGTDAYNRQPVARAGRNDSCVSDDARPARRSDRRAGARQSRSGEQRLPRRAFGGGDRVSRAGPAREDRRRRRTALVSRLAGATRPAARRPASAPIAAPMCWRARSARQAIMRRASRPCADGGERRRAVQRTAVTGTLAMRTRRSRMLRWKQ